MALRKRYEPATHSFRYPIYMLSLDLDELPQIDRQLRFFSVDRFAPFSFRRSDYLGDPQMPIKQAVLSQVDALGGDSTGLDRVMFLGQVRCFGLYFSPVNFYFCYQGSEARYMIAEVHNTPWNESHCYLVDVNSPQATQKDFHVSPFRGMDMDYHWQIDLHQKRLRIHIENWQSDKLFDATLSLQQRELNSMSLFSTLKQWPVMTLSIVRGIYWQALKLFIKKVPYHSHP